MANFKKATFSEERYRHHREFLMTWAKEIDDLRQRLEAEGLPNNREFIEKITADEMALDVFIKAEFNDYLKRVGFVPKGERQRILENYNSLFFSVKPLVSAASSALQKGIILEADGTVNEKKLEEISREKATFIYDIPVMQEFYQLVCEAQTAINALKDFEEKNKLSTHFTLVLAAPCSEIVLPPRILTFEGDETAFQRNFGEFFPEKK